MNITYIDVMCHDLFCLSLFGGDQLPMELLLPKSIRDRHESLFDGDYTPIFSFQFPTILADDLAG